MARVAALTDIRCFDARTETLKPLAINLEQLYRMAQKNLENSFNFFYTAHSFDQRLLEALPYNRSCTYATVFSHENSYNESRTQPLDTLFRHAQGSLQGRAIAILLRCGCAPMAFIAGSESGFSAFLFSLC